MIHMKQTKWCLHDSAAPWLKVIDVLLIHDPYVDEMQTAMAPGGLSRGR
jgi:hypothetical protein